MKELVCRLIETAFVADAWARRCRRGAQSKYEQEIRALEDQFCGGRQCQDVDAIMKVYIPGNDLFVFDVGVPRQHVGWMITRRTGMIFSPCFLGQSSSRSAT